MAVFRKFPDGADIRHYRHNECLSKESAHKYLQFIVLHRSKGAIGNSNNPVKFKYLLIYVLPQHLYSSTINQTTNKLLKSIAAGVAVVVVIIIIIIIIIIVLVFSLTCFVW
jgi:hypothetical protein